MGLHLSLLQHDLQRLLLQQQEHLRTGRQDNPRTVAGSQADECGRAGAHSFAMVDQHGLGETLLATVAIHSPGLALQVHDAGGQARRQRPDQKPSIRRPAQRRFGLHGRDERSQGHEHSPNQLPPHPVFEAHEVNTYPRPPLKNLYADDEGRIAPTPHTTLQPAPLSPTPGDCARPAWRGTAPGQRATAPLHPVRHQRRRPPRWNT
ncbi:hypothetical protein D9M68_748350 [compost metagenome]